MTKRLFIAIDLPKAACFRLARLLPQPPHGVRPVRSGRIHLTLHFLGNVAEDRLSPLCAALGRVRRTPFELTIRGTGRFPPHGRPTTLWAGIADSSRLVDLHAAIAAAIVACGIEIERRPYLPHVTLARLMPAAPRAWTAAFLAETAGLEITGIPVERFQLFSSRRLDGATEHSVEKTFPLVIPPAAGDEQRGEPSAQEPKKLGRRR